MTRYPLSNLAKATRLLALLFVFGVFSAAPALAEETPATFMQSLQDDAIKQLGDTSIPEEEREARFRELFNTYLDVPAIGKFVAGRYWKGADKVERTNFLNVFEDVMVQRFLPIFAENSDLRLMFDGYRKHAKHDGMFIVNSRLPRKTGEEVKVSWIVRHSGDKKKVLDIVIEGTSMALTLRSEYSAFLKKNGKKLANLTASLRDKVEQGAFTAQIN